MSDVHGRSEQQFVGAGRRLLVDGLVAIYDRVRTTSTPAWVALEAPSGWGKTRIVREFYAALAGTQEAPAYWPASIVNSTPSAYAPTALEDRRKAVNPADFAHVPLSRPTFMWWGISCASSNGTATETLSRDFGVVKDHANYLEDAWHHHSSFRKKYAAPVVKGLRDKIVGDGIDDAVEAAATALAAGVGLIAEASIPGYSVGKYAVGKAAGGVRSAAERRSRHHSDGDIGTADDLVEQIRAMLTKLAIPELPVVVFVEDVHDAHPMLLELLEKLVGQPAPILIITTGWPGYSQRNEALGESFRIAGRRLVAIDETSVPPIPFAPGASLAAMDRTDLSELFDGYYPLAAEQTKRALLDKYSVPLHLELALLTFHGEFMEGETFELEPGEIVALPSELLGLYQKLWTQLDPATQKILMLATLGIPAAVQRDQEASHAWDQQMLDAALRNSGQTAPAANALRLDRSWVRFIDETLRQFQVPEQMDIAAQGFSMREPVKRAVRAALIAEAGRRLAGDAEGRGAAEEEKTQAARLLIAYGPEHSDDHLISAKGHLIGLLSEHYREAPEIVRLGAPLISHLDLRDDDHRMILEHYAGALQGTGDIDGALIACRQMLDAENEVFAPDDPAVFATRAWIASLTDLSGRHETAAMMFEEVLRDRDAARLGDDLVSLGYRRRLGQAIWASGSPRRAVEVLEDVVSRLDKLGLGQSDEGWHTRLSLGEAVLASGDAAEAIRTYRSLADDLHGSGNADHPLLLSVRGSIARAVEAAEGPAQAAKLFEIHVADETATLGPDAPNTLVSRENLARTLSAAGDLDRGIPMYEELIADQRRLLRPDHLTALRTRHNLGGALIKAGRAAEAEVLYRELLDHAAVVFGTLSPGYLSIQANLAWALEAVGDFDAALRVYREVLASRTALFEAGHPVIDESQESLAVALAQVGEIEEAREVHRVLTRSLVQRHGHAAPRVSRAYGVFAQALRDNGFDAEARSVVQEGLDGQSRQSEAHTEE